MTEQLETLSNVVDDLYARLNRADPGSSTKITSNSELKVKGRMLTDFTVESEIWNHTSLMLEELNSDYFVAQLYTNTKDFSLGCKPSKNLSDSRWLDHRYSFVDFFSDSLLDFSSERRAKHSTQVMLHQILVENNICIQCSSKVAKKKLMVTYNRQ